MGDLTIGSALVIDDKTLAKIQEIDNKIKNIQTTADATAKGVSKSFSDMANGVNPFITALDSVITKLNTIQTSASNAGSGLNNIASGTSNIGAGASQTTQGIIDLVNRLSQVGGKGSSSIMQAVLAFQRLQESTKGASGMNIAQLKEEISAINKMLNDVSHNLTKVDQDGLIKRKKTLQDELKYQQQMCEERVVAFQKALDRMSSAEQSYNNKQKRLYNDRTKDYQNKNYKSNTTYQGALDFSATANTLNRQVRAIEYLKEARMKLSTTDVDYKRKLETLNAAISEHNKKLKEAGINTRQLGEKTSYLAGYLIRLAQRTAVVFSLGAAKNFVGQIAEVRGQFELSQRSLEAILQNKPKADEIFNKTVELAVKSPFRIKDLVDYTRQLSAYRIESDKLYDTTKRLADVSAGLGVDMGRLILAYGQVKAAAYLRGSEVRQFTEAGINMYGELQQYFKEVKGEAYTTAQIVDMISKRMVKFEDVEAVFQRMTDKGGMFYNMQEVQANTLYGMIQKMHDAFDVMLNDIGKANEDTFKGSIQFATDMLKHWEAISNAGKALLSVIIAIKVHSIFMRTSLAKSIVIDQAMVGKWQAFLNIFRTMPTTISQGFTKAKNAIVAASGAIKAALGGIALYAVIQTVLNYRDALNECEKAINKSHETTVKTLGKISELSIKYKELSENVTGAANAQNASNSSNAKTIDEKRKALQKLIDYANQEGLNIKLNIDTLNETQLDEQFKIIEKKYRDFAFELEAIMERAAQSDKDGWWWGISGITEGLQEYKTASIDIISQTNKIEQAMALVTSNYRDANKYTKQYFDTLRNGRNEGEEDIDYLVRMNNAWKNLEAYYSKNSMVLPKWIVEGQSYMKDLSGSFKDLDSAIAQTKENFKDVFVGKGGIEEFKKKYQKDPLKLKAEIDQYAAEKSLSDTEKRLLYWVAQKQYGIKFPSDVSKEGAERAIKTILEDLQDIANKNKITISVDVKDPKNLNGVIDGYQKSAKDWQETIENIQRSTKKFFTGAYLDIGNKEKWNGQWVDSQTVFTKQLALQYAQKQKEAAMYWNTQLGGKNPFEKDDKKKQKDAEKAQRDILNERISLLKDMSSEYQKLIKYEGEEQATADVRKHFALAAKNVGMNINNFIPDRQTIAKKIEYLASQYKELGKRGSALRNATEIRLDIDEEYFKQQLDDAKNNAQDAFSQLDLFKKLKGEGLSDSIIKSMFGDLTSSFDDVRKSITDDFEAKWGKDQTKWGDDVAKEYASQMQKLDKEVYQDQVNQAQELIKAYKTNLTERLQLDKWYYEEYMKIQNNTNISKNKEMQEQMTENLKKQFRKKSADIDWKEFQNTDTYISIFENLDHTSTKALDYMIDRLDKMREQLKGLDPTQVKALTEQMEKLRQTRDARNPFKAFTTGLKETTKANNDLKKLGGIKEWISKNKQNDAEKDDIKANEDRVAQLEAEVKQSEILNGFEDERTKNLKLSLGFEKATLASKKAQNKETQDSVNNLNNAKDASEKAQNKFSKSVTDITSVVSTMATAFNGLFEALGGSDEQLENTLSVVDNIGQAIGSYYSGNYAGVAAGAMGALTGVAKLFSNEGKIDKEIARQERAVNSLQHAYEKLKKSMDDAFDTQRLYEYNQKSVDALKKQQKAYQAMINAERGRKKPDEGKIQEWEQQIDDLNTTIQELGESMTEALGGFGSQSNYKSAAEAFSEAWVDAFNEGSDALEALNNKFDEYFNTMLTKQLMNRATSKYIQPILEAFDKAVSEGSEGGNNGLDVTKKELEGIKELKDKNLALFNEYAKNLMDVLNVKPTGSSNISALQQGIQSVTESTAQALESILNSLRYYVATQQADVRIIRDTLLEKLGNSISAITQDTSSSPVLIELRLQTTILTDIRDTLASCVKGGHKQGRNGIKVFMN